MRFLEHVQVKDREKENIFIVQVIVFLFTIFSLFSPAHSFCQVSHQGSLGDRSGVPSR